MYALLQSTRIQGIYRIHVEIYDNTITNLIMSNCYVIMSSVGNRLDTSTSVVMRPNQEGMDYGQPSFHIKQVHHLGSVFVAI